MCSANAAPLWTNRCTREVWNRANSGADLEVEGAPPASRRSPRLDRDRRRPLVHECTKTAESRGVGLRKHAVTEVEDVTRPTARPAEHVERRGLDALPRAEQDGGVEIALDAALGADLVPAAVELDPPVEADHVAAGGSHLREQRSRPGAEVDRRTVDRGQDARRGGRN